MRVGITFSTFDLCHAGHVQMLREAKDNCDYLIACLQSDPTIDRPDTKNPPVQTMVERYVQLSGIKYVDEIIPYQTEQDVLDILQMYSIDLRVIGAEYKGQKFTGDIICEERGIEIYFNKRDHRFSTTNLRKKVVSDDKRRISGVFDVSSDTKTL